MAVIVENDFCLFFCISGCNFDASLMAKPKRNSTHMRASTLKFIFKYFLWLSTRKDLLIKEEEDVLEL